MKATTRSFYEQAVQRAIEHIATRLDAALDLQTLARDACLSPFHFHRVFRGMVGETPLELIRRLRLERAAWQLSKTDARVTEIAFDAGYDTHEAFTRAFRACFSASPSGFRQRTLRRIELAAACGVHFDPAGRVPAFIPRDSGGQHMNVDIVDLPDRRVATVRHVGPYNLIGQAFGTLGAIVGPAGLTSHKDAQMVAIYHDDPDTTPPDRLRADAGLVVPEGITLPPGLEEARIPAGRYARTVHVGPYDYLGDVWARFMGEWLPNSGHRLGAGTSFERYLNTPMTTPKHKLETELYISIA